MHQVTIPHPGDTGVASATVSLCTDSSGATAAAGRRHVAMVCRGTSWIHPTRERGRDGKAPAALHPGGLIPAQRFPSIPAGDGNTHRGKAAIWDERRPPGAEGTAPPALPAASRMVQQKRDAPRRMSCLSPSLLSQEGSWGAIKQAGNVSAKLSAGPQSAEAGGEEVGIYSSLQGEQPPAANMLWV